MVRINKARFVGWMLCLLLLALLAGCSAAIQARSAFDEAERLAAEEQFDLAVDKYLEATELDPGNMTYKLKLVSSKTRAAAFHVRKARQLRDQGNYAQALEEYGLARGFDPSIEVAIHEANELRKRIEAQKFAEEGATFYSKNNLLLAAKAIDKALELDSGNARALAIKDLLDQAQHAVFMDGIELDVASDEPITLSFKDANIKEVFGIISELSGINFIYDEEIRSQSISVLLEKASFAQAMELIMQMNGLGKKVLNSKTIIIYPQSREKAKQYDDQLIQSFYLSHIDAKKAVNLLRTMLQLRKIYVHEERNAIVVRDKPQVIRLAEQILDAADRSDSEVLFDVEVLAVTDTDKLLFGPELNEKSSTVGFDEDLSKSIVTQSLGGLETFYSVPSATFDLAKSLSTTEILASPKIRVKNKEKAKVHIGNRDPVVTTSGSTSDSGFTSQNVQYVDSGIKLDIEPTVQLDGTVLAKIKLEVSSAARLNSDDTTGQSPIALTTTNAETSLVLLDGVRTILGGLYETVNQDIKSTIPFIGEIPLVGSLFTNYDTEERKREIILSITPYIIKKVSVPEVDVATIWSGGEDNLKDGPNFGAFAEELSSDFESTKPLAAPAVKPVDIVLEASRTATDEAPQGEIETLAAEEEPVTDDAEDSPVKLADEAEPGDDVVEPEPEPAEPAKVEPPAQPVAEPSPEEMSPPSESVPVEVIQVPEEAGAPIVLPMPKKLPAVITFSGPKQVDSGKEFNLAVIVNEAERLYSAPLFVRYDPAMLELVTINEGDFLKQGGQATVFSSSPNRTTGQIIVGYKQGTGGKGASGTGTLFNLVFKPVSAGETRVETNRINFRNPDGVRLQVVPEAVMIEVR